MICNISGPFDTLGQLLFDLVRIPLDVTIVTFSKISYILPYLFFFIPDQRVDTHPPTVEN